MSPALPGDAGLMMSVSRDEAALRAEMKAIAEGWSKPEPDRAALRARNREVQRRLIASIDPDRAAALFTAMREHDVTAVPTLVWSNGLLPAPKDDWPDAETLALVPKAVRERWLQRRQTQAAAASDADLALNQAIASASVAFVGAMHRAGVAVVAGTDAFDSYLPLGPRCMRNWPTWWPRACRPSRRCSPRTREVGAAARHDRVARHHRGWQAGRPAAARRGPDGRHHARPERIHAVIQAGRVLDRGSLDRMLADVRAAADR